MTAPTAEGSISEMQAGESQSTFLHPTHGGRWSRAALFAGLAVLLFLLNSRVVNVFDEGLLLTGTMRTMAGQVLHRDFYYNYGPAQLYILAGLFRIFGPSVLVERLTESGFAAALAVSLYVLARRFCTRAVAVAALALCLLWIVGVMMLQSLMNPALCTLMLWAAWLILPVGDSRIQRRRAAAAGALAGVAFLFRYDMGLGLLAANLFAAVLMMALRERVSKESVRSLLATIFGPYVVTFLIVTLPAVIAYLAVAPLHDLLYDVVIYNAKYYRAGRGLPFPKLEMGPNFENVVVYVLPLLIALGMWLAANWLMKRRATPSKQFAREIDAANLMIALSVIAATMYIKGFIRITAGQMNGSTIPCILIGAILFQYRAQLRLWLRGLLGVMLLLLFLTAVSATDVKLLNPTHLRPIVLNWIVTPSRQPPSRAFQSWCHDKTPITRGFCFLLDDNHIQTLRYIEEHTGPADYLYVGIPHHDRILINDNITYFAAQRLPAVRWTQFDPFLENRADIQQEMIGSIEQHRPPYVVLDGEFEGFGEANGSSVSTGVHLLDDYIAAHYTPVQQYGTMTILKRDQ